jgi:hypothetical protein
MELGLVVVVDGPLPDMGAEALNIFKLGKYAIVALAYVDVSLDGCPSTVTKIAYTGNSGRTQEIDHCAMVVPAILLVRHDCAARWDGQRGVRWGGRWAAVNTVDLVLLRGKQGLHEVFAGNTCLRESEGTIIVHGCVC